MQNRVSCVFHPQCPRYHQIPVIPAPVFTRVNSGGNPVVIKENPGFRIKSGIMTIWRELLKAGALPFKGSVYILPYTEEHYELLTWLVSEVISLKSEGSFVRAEKTETSDNQEIIGLFNKQRGFTG